MQKGLATLEIILAIIIIAVLTKFALPNAARILDGAALDYENKRLYSELRFVQEKGKATTIDDIGMEGIIKENGLPTCLFIYPDKNYYQVFRGTDTNKKAIREPHYLANGITISFKSGVPQNAITFNEAGNAIKLDRSSLSNTLILTSRFGKKYIVFNSVGRMRASLIDYDN